MKQTIITCDICGKSINSDYTASIYLRRCNTSTSKELDLCEKCFDDLVHFLKLEKEEFEIDNIIKVST